MNFTTDKLDYFEIIVVIGGFNNIALPSMWHTSWITWPTQTHAVVQAWTSEFKVFAHVLHAILGYPATY